MDRTEERRIIELAIAGDRDAAGSLVRHHQKSVYAYLLRMCGRPDIAEDITQEAFVRVLTHIERFDFRYRFSTWLFTIARRLYLNQAAKMKPAFDTAAVDAAAGDLDSEWRSAAAEDLRATQRAAIDRALQSLSTEQREAVVLFHQFDWPIAQIAAHLGMPEGTIKSHLHRGRRRLREALRRSPRVLASLEVTADPVGRAAADVEAGAP